MSDTPHNLPIGHFLIAIAMLVSTTSACISNPARGAVANGNPLRVEIRSGTGTRTVQKETGGSYTTDSNGYESETVNYKNVEEKYKWKDWSFYQGHTRLDEQDWFALTDPATSAAIADARASAYRKQAIGLPVFLLGVAGAVYSTYGLDREQHPTAARWAYTGSGLVAILGGLVYYVGFQKMRDKTLMPLSRAVDTADEVTRCNEGRCRTMRRTLGMRR